MQDYLFRTLTNLAGLGLVEVGNVRGEFACNSSSSHSILVLPDGVEAEDSLYEDGDSYGTFALASSTEKVHFMATALSGNVDVDHFSDRLTADLSEWDKEMYSSFEGEVVGPRDIYGSVEEEFLQEMIDLIISSPRVVIVGKSDSGYGDDPYSTLKGVFGLGFIEEHGYRVRKDTAPDGSYWWVLFSKRDGTKMRLRLRHDTIHADLTAADGGVGFSPEKAATPELVDVKLTDRCPFELDCGFCYMGSTRKGPEGDAARVQELLLSLADLDVFEVAFGGGEPTLWPQMEETMRFCRSVGIVPNFTTKNYTFLSQQPELLELAGSVAVSINDERSLKRFAKEAAKHRWDVAMKVTIQVIPEIVETAFLEKVLAWAKKSDCRVTLLGYKETGRGGTFDGRLDRPKGFWLDLVKKYRSVPIAIDTTLAESCQAELVAAGVPEWCYHTTEGKFSLYVDAVTGHVGPSSYCSSEEMEELDFSTDLTGTLRSAFSSY